MTNKPTEGKGIKINDRPVTRQELDNWGKKMDKKLSKMIDDTLLPFFRKI